MPEQPTLLSRGTQALKNASRDCAVVAALSVLSVYFYFLMEWIFFATKPSFMSSLAVPEKFSALVIPPGLFCIAFLCAIALLRLLSGAIASATGVNIFSRTAPILPALPLAASLFILVDNYTYTLFDYGVISSDGPARPLYGLWFLLLLLASYFFLYRRANALATSASPRSLITLAGILLGISAADSIYTLATDTRSSGASVNAQTQLDRLPNILLISSDGIDANRTSIYGYERDTTPFLRARMKDALVFENAFTNAPSTRPSLASMFTGKLPSTNRLLGISGILQGEHAYQHLPGILRNLGYESMDITYHFVGGSFDYNLRNSFDVSDSRTVQWQKISLPGSLSIVFANAEFMISEVVDRIRERLLHAFLIEKMVDEFEELTHEKKEFFRASADDLRLKSLYDFIETANEPFLVHAHFMGTHGPKFDIEYPKFSFGQEQSEDWMEDFYDDSILQFDGYVEEMFRRLEQSGKLDNSIIMVNTDHAKGPGHSRTHARLPFLIFFPNSDHKGRVRSNVQLLDLAPTLLDYLQVDKPGWMEGDSVLREEPDRLRPIHSFYSARGSEEPGHPIYEADVVICNQLYSMQFPIRGVGRRPIDGHTDPCSVRDLPDRDEVKQLILDHLVSREFDLSRDVRQTKPK
ncbi:MAG: sulfatase-like hydrolase/transferase [Deltaproteobacteria bacterium]|nr:sulfatase-like hydrolase/transferase [Deltaproteobacteria bacterium]